MAVKKQIQETISAIESSLARGDVFIAHDLANDARSQYPGNVRITQLHALALARLGVTEEARACLEDLYESGSSDSETMGILGRVYKDILKKSGDIDYAFLSRDTYLKGFEALQEYYLGINAATMSYILGEKEKAEGLAREVIKLVKKEGRDFWSLATLGEAYLIVGDLERAVKYYRMAYEKSADNYGNLNSSYQQLCFIEKYREVPAEILKIFKPRGVIAFSGHMIDRPGQTETRFPAYLADTVKGEIVRIIDDLNAGIGYCSAACGSDILFIEAMLERGAEVHVFLPFCREDFLKTSVLYAGREWEDRFNRVLEKVPVRYVTEEGYWGNDGLFSFLNDVIMGMSIIRSRILLTEPVFLTVLAGKEHEMKQGGTKDLFEKWPFKESVRIIDPSALAPAPGKAGLSESGGECREYSFGAIPPGISREPSCILFANIVGMSERQEDLDPFFMHNLLRLISQNLDQLDIKPKVFNSWGNELYSVYDSAKGLVEFALMLCDIVLKTDWKLNDPNSTVNIKIALHVGPVLISSDPVSGRRNAFGTHINRTVCMESITVPGCIYASEQFTAMLVVETGDLYRYEYVGTQALAGGAGSMGMFHLSRRDDFSFLISDYKRQQKVESEGDGQADQSQILESLQSDMVSFLNEDGGEEARPAPQGSTFEWLILYMKKESYAAGHILFSKDDKADSIFYIEKGVLLLKEMNINVGAGELIGETGLFSPFRTRTVSAMCVTDMEIYSIGQDRMIELLYKKPSLLFDLIQLSIKRFTLNLTRAVEEKERIEGELKVATSIQMSMLPAKFPSDGRFDIYATMEPAKEVGGDFYDFFFIGEDEFCFIIGDVSGKGVPAALFMVISKTLLRIEAMRKSPPDKVLNVVNSMLCPDNNECMFVTVFCAVLNVKTGRLDYANAGHNPPLISHNGTDFEFMTPMKGCVLGALSVSQYYSESLMLSPGDVVYLYTDGVNEAMNRDQRQYSNEGLKSTLRSLMNRDVKEIINVVRGDVRSFVGDAPQSDDITMLAVKYFG